MEDCACSSTAIYPREIETELGGREREKERGARTHMAGYVCSPSTVHLRETKGEGEKRELEFTFVSV